MSRRVRPVRSAAGAKSSLRRVPERYGLKTESWYNELCRDSPLGSAGPTVHFQDAAFRFEEIMSQRYKLTCRCGKEYPVEASQAGRVIRCACGSRLSIPSMIKVKRLPLWADAPSAGSPPEAAEEPAAAPEKDAPAAPAPLPAAPEPRRAKLPAARKGLTVVGSLAFVLFTALFFYLLFSPPRPIDVLNIQRFYVDHGKVIQRDSNPIEASDAYFFVTKDNYVVNDSTIDLMTPAYAVEYFDYLKTGLNLSDNYYDKYDSLIVRRRITMVFFAVLAGLSLTAAVIPFFLSKERKTVGAARGSDWKS